MKLLQIIAVAILDANKWQAETAFGLMLRVGLYRRLYEAAGLDRAMAMRLEGAMADAMYRGIDEQHALALRWIRDEIDFPEFVDEYERWFGRHLGRTSKVTADALAGERHP